ncbi:MAG TPA: hypothetical protein VI504_15750 [Candidatus Eisenbacteria bacterium]|jgi:hypothetical protein
MTPIRRLALNLLFVLACLAATALPCRAQSGGSARFAFADTTLLRDTLDLHFDRLFETADSLHMLPDTLRAQVIRFRLPIRRLLAMADSMGVPVDSVGDVIFREGLNPLTANGGAAASTFRYTSGYNFGRTSTTWTNGSDYTVSRGAILLRNNTDISMDRQTGGGRLSLQQTRGSTSELNWRLNPDLSIGGRAVLSGFDNTDQGASNNVGERKSEFQLSSRSRQNPVQDLTSELNLFGGYLDLKNSSQIKRGLSADFNGRLRLQSGKWLSHDLNGGVNGNLSRTRTPTSLVTLRTSDYSGNLRGALLLFESAPVGLNLNYSMRNTRVETPTSADTVQRLLTSGNSIDATLRLRRSNDRYLNLSGNTGLNNTLQGSRTDKGVRAEGRWAQGPWALDGNYSDLIGDSRYPRRNRAFGYVQNEDNHLASAQLSRPFGRKLTAQLSTNVSLSRLRSRATADSASLPTPRDSYQQSYRLQTLYNQSEKLNTGVALEVSLSRLINLPAVSTSNNTDTRSYRAEWRWSYRMLRGLTASQTNTIQSDYEFFPFASERNDLTLNYNSVTTLAAVLTPRLTLNVIHNARQQPRGDWRTLPDGSGVLLPSEQSLDYTLRAPVTWSPSPAVSFTITPEYLASDRTGTSNGVEVPTRRNRHLNFTGGTNLNLAIARKGHLTGIVNRNFSSDRSTTFLNGLPQHSPLTNTDYWQGQLQLSWEL